MSNLFLTCLALVFILEGLLPFLVPTFWRQMMQQLIAQSDRSLRIFGLVIMLLGLGLLYLIRY